MGRTFCVTKWGLVDFTVNHVISGSVNICGK